MPGVPAARPAHHQEKGLNVPLDGRRSSYARAVEKGGWRRAVPPLGSPLISTTKSVAGPVSELIASSEMMSEEPGETIALMRSSVSCGMDMRSSAAFAPLILVGAASPGCLLAEPEPGGGDMDTAF